MDRIKISIDHIKKAELHLLEKDKSFESKERIPFIQNLNTCDLLAVPGSGKTTALLAKLYCLEKHLPFEDGSGILVLSHTNAAVDQIKSQLQHLSPKLFEYPNFVGTIQRFINEFLAIPHYVQEVGSKPIHIDNEKYRSQLKNLVSNTFIARKEVKHLFNVSNLNWVYTFYISEKDGELLLYDRIGGKEISISKPRGRAKNPTDWNQETKEKIKINLIKVKKNIMEDGILSFEDCYYLASRFLKKRPSANSLLQSRFKYVFVDEMQDLDDYQIQIIDDVFFQEGSKTIIQRIGDKNQAIYSSGTTVKEECDWKTREESNPKKYKDLAITGSYRLTNEIAEIVDSFVLKVHPINYKVTGKRKLDKTIPPHLLVFDWGTKDQLIDVFKELIQNHQLTDHIPSNPDHPFSVIAWSGNWKEDERNNASIKKKVRLEDICFYSKEEKSKKEDFDSLSKHIQLFDREKRTLEAIRKSILNALIHVLRLEGKKYDAEWRGKKVERYYSKSKLIEFLKNHEKANVYEDFKSKLYDWCIKVIQRKERQVFTSVKEFMEGDFRNWFALKINTDTQSFIGDFEEIPLTQSNNIFNKDYLNIEVGSVHSAKGQTHCCTLYIETAYKRPVYETLKIKSRRPFFKETHNCTSDMKMASEALKMMYVGFSRPTHLLCFAALKENLAKDDLEKFDKAGWKIKDLTASSQNS
ncbi:MAG: UvrD-helicase domain-containing protein [Bacteroidota bacterium]